MKLKINPTKSTSKNLSPSPAVVYYQTKDNKTTNGHTECNTNNTVRQSALCAS